jgi:hypothetical protein
MTLRRLTINGILILLIGGSLFDIALGREDWPFSDYSMFSAVQRTSTVTTWRLYGVTETGELPLVDSAQISPFDQSSLARSLRRLSHAEEGRMTRALSDCWHRYEARRLRGEHAGPRLVGVRAYRATWTLTPWAANVAQPDRLDLLGEVVGARQ